MFIGSNIVKPDAKGRIAVPARHRERLRACCGSRVALTVHPLGAPCLWMYPWNEWEDVYETVSKLSPLRPQNARLQHLVLSNAFELELDSQGRILLPPSLRTHADIDHGGEVAVVGLGKRFEIWDATAWEALTIGYMADATAPGSDASSDLENLPL